LHFLTHKNRILCNNAEAAVKVMFAILRCYNFEMNVNASCKKRYLVLVYELEVLNNIVVCGLCFLCSRCAIIHFLLMLGFGGSPRILDIGGVPYLMPIADKSKVKC